MKLKLLRETLLELLTAYRNRKKAWKKADALSCLKFISSDNKDILNSSSMFSGNLDRNIIDFMNDKEELLITFEKDTFEDVHVAASEGITSY